MVVIITLSGHCLYNLPSSFIDDPLPTPTPESVFLEDVQLPDEVAQFFHSKSFHPEDLENLRGILKRSQDHCLPQPQSSSFLDERSMARSGNMSSQSDLPHRVISPNDDNSEKLQRHPPLPEPNEQHCRYTEAHRSLFSTFEDMKQYFASYALMNRHSIGGRYNEGQLGRGRKTGTVCLNLVES